MTPPLDRTAQARRGLTIYFAVVVIVSAALEGWIITHGGLMANGARLVFPLMWTPAIASIIARLALREGFGDVSFRFGGRDGGRAILAAWLFPLVVGLLAYGVAWTTGLAHFEPPSLSPENPVARFAVRLAQILTIGTVMSALSAAGEEIGWRGYMVPRLVEAKVRQPLLVSAIIWCTWHVPLILWAGYAVGPYPLLSVLCFYLVVTPMAFLIGRWRLATGSVWPAIMGHAAWNAIIQGAFDRSSQGQGIELWIGESGLLVVVAVWLVYFFLTRRGSVAAQVDLATGLPAGASRS